MGVNSGGVGEVTLPRKGRTLDKRRQGEMTPLMQDGTSAQDPQKHGPKTADERTCCH